VILLLVGVTVIAVLPALSALYRGLPEVGMVEHGVSVNEFVVVEVVLNVLNIHCLNVYAIEMFAKIKS